MYAWLGLALALAVFAAANLAGSLVAYGAWRLLRPVLARVAARTRANWLLGLGVLPAALALFLTAGLVTPAYLLHEPADAGEAPGVLLLALAITGALLIASAVRTTVRVLRATRRFLQERLSGARTLALTEAPAQAFVVGPAFPSVSLVGFSRPRLLLAGPVLAALQDDELSLVLAHEAGHAATRDNLKGLILRAAPCWAGLEARIEREWQQASEQAADDYAAAGCADRALSLAAALVKVARMAPHRAAFDPPATAFHSGEGIADRVQRLLAMARQDPSRQAPAASKRRHLWILALALSLAAVTPGLLSRVHLMLEHVVRGLP